jgi:hypothetical protein
MASENNYPKLHNAMWPGIVGKGAGRQRADHRARYAARTDRQRRSRRAEVRRRRPVHHRSAFRHRQRCRRRSSACRPHRELRPQGRLLRRADLGRAGGGSAMGDADERKRFLTQVEKGLRSASRCARSASARPAGIRIDSSTGVEDWDKDPEGNTKKIAETFREAGKIAQDHGEFIVAEGEICWGGMHSWRENVKLLEMVNMPDVVGYQADMAHSMLFVLGANAEKDRSCPPTTTGATRPRSMPPTRRSPTRCAPGPRFPRRPERRHDVRLRRPRKDRPALPGRRPERPARYGQARRLLAARREGNLTKRMRHICWDGCMFPNAVMEAGDLEQGPRRHDQGARRARLAGSARATWFDELTMRPFERPALQQPSW